MTQLYTETKELVEMRKLLEEDNLPSEAIQDTLESMAGEFEEKGIAMFQASDELDYDVQAIDSMIKELQSRKKAIQNKKENMRRALLDAMLTSGIKKISCPYFTLSVVKGAGKVVVEDEELLPDDYVTVKTEIKPDKKAIAEGLKNGDLTEHDGARFEPGTETLRVTKGS